MAKLYYSKIAAASVTATSAAAGAPASNMLLESLGRAWNSTSTVQQTVIIDLGSSQHVDSLALHDVNFASATLAYSPDNVTYTAAGSIATFADDFGRYRGRATFNVTARYLRFVIAAGTPADGLGYFRVGSAYVFASSVAPTSFPRWSYRVTTNRPRSSVDLPNGITAAAVAGVRVDLVELSVEAFTLASESLSAFLQFAEVGVIWLDLAVTNPVTGAVYPEQQWPVRLLEPKIPKDFDRPGHAVATIPFREIT